MKLTKTPQTVKEIAAAAGKSESHIRELLKTAVYAGDAVKISGRPAKYKAADKPKAKRVNINPQPAIDKMVAQAAEAGHELVYDRASRTWNVGNHSLTSQELAAALGGGFDKWLAANV